ncbi:MAG: helix-turn-helix transcriptional regulator [Steroidobacteraceae bacterium]|jgi:DNA-binding transcriptional ArsR family regulator
MDATADSDTGIAAIAAVIGDPTRARMLVSLMDGRARTGTELAAVAEVAPSTASVHLQRLQAARLVSVQRQGKHHYYTLGGVEIASVLERLSALAGTGRRGTIVCRAPQHLRAARTCYDHIAGSIGVALLERFAALGWLAREQGDGAADYGLTAAGTRALAALGLDVQAARAARRRFAFGCLDWTERRHHLGGALGAAFLQLATRRKWVLQDLDSRALRLTDSGRRELTQLGVNVSGEGGAPCALRLG